MGERVGNKNHSTKDSQYIKAFERWLENHPSANLYDRAAAENIINDLREALTQ